MKNGAVLIQGDHWDVLLQNHPEIRIENQTGRGMHRQPALLLHHNKGFYIFHAFHGLGVGNGPVPILGIIHHPHEHHMP